MKKLLVLISLLLLLVGCEMEQEKFYLDDFHYSNNNEIKEITKEEFEKLEEDKKNIAIFVYLPGCTSCAQFNEVLTEFSKNNNVSFYKVKIGDVKDTSIDDAIEYAPSLLLYKEGKVVDYLDALSDDDKPALTTEDGLTKWLEKYVYFSK